MARLVFVSLALVAMVALVPLVSAHRTVDVDGTSFRIGWESEPPLTGTKNAILVWVYDNATGAARTGLADSMKLTVSESGKTKTLTVVESDEAPGNYSAAILPTAPGQLSVSITATMTGGKSISVPATKVEEVGNAGDLAFPAPLVDASDLASQVADLKTEVAQLKAQVAAQPTAATKSTPGFETPLVAAAVLGAALVVASRRRS